MYYNNKMVPHIGTRPVSPGFVAGSVLPPAPVAPVAVAAPVVAAAPALVTSTVAPVVAPAIATTAVVEAPPVGNSFNNAGGSRFEYVPYNRTVMDYEIRQYAEMVPRQRTITEFEERRYMETVPRTVIDNHMYAIEHVRQYVPEVMAEAIVETTPVERIVQRTEYIPYER